MLKLLEVLDYIGILCYCGCVYNFETRFYLGVDHWKQQNTLFHFTT